MSTFVEDDPQQKQNVTNQQQQEHDDNPIQTFLNTLGQDLDIIVQVWV